jgi:SpoVK/Ycf46/Vps4 family AAA+-type ATPase
MDGVDIAKEDGVLVLGGTNRPWSLDSALLRPGRLGDKIIYLPPPDEMARRALFEKHFSMPVGHDVVMSWDWESLIRLSTSMTGAEIVGACLQAKTRWLKQSLQLAKESKSEERSNEYSATNFPLPSSSLFGVESILISELRAIKPMLSNPDAVDEFRLFGHKQT